MKLPKGHIIKTLVKYNMKTNSLNDFVKEVLNGIDKFTGYVRILADKGEYEEEIKVILSDGEIIGGELKLLSSGTVFYGNECRFEVPFEFHRCGVSVVRLTSSDIGIVKISRPECVIVKEINVEGPELANQRDQLLKKYRIKEMSDSEITNLLEKMNGD